MAFVDLDEEDAASLESKRHLRIGWVRCRVTRRQSPTRCFRCHGFGHVAATCKEKDRSKACWKCGEEGHVAAICTKSLRCFLCAEKAVGKVSLDHVPGSSRCLARKEALSSKTKS